MDIFRIRILRRIQNTGNFVDFAEEFYADFDSGVKKISAYAFKRKSRFKNFARANSKNFQIMSSRIAEG